MNHTADSQAAKSLLELNTYISKAYLKKLMNEAIDADTQSGVQLFLENNNLHALRCDDFLKALFYCIDRQRNDCFLTTTNEIIDPVTSANRNSYNTVSMSNLSYSNTFPVVRKESVARSRENDFKTLAKIKSNLEANNYIFISPRDEREEIVPADEEESHEILIQLIPDLKDANAHLHNERRVKLLSVA